MQEESNELSLVLSRIAKIDQSAAAFLSSILNIAATWDDLIDRDVDILDADINETLELALISLPRNRFYSDNFNLLHPLVMSSIFNWHIATSIERGWQEKMFSAAFIIRSSYADIFVMTAFLLGGRGLAIEIGLQVHEIVHDEGFYNYVSSVEEEQRQRKERR